jgi:hypothetical protein
MPKKTVWLKTGAADVRIGVKRKYLSLRIIVPESVRKNLLKQLLRFEK